MGTIILILGCFAVLTGIAIRYVIKRRKFSRRAITGREQFSSYEKAWSINFLESTFKFIGFIFILAGLLLILLGWWYANNEVKKHPIETTKPTE